MTDLGKVKVICQILKVTRIVESSRDYKSAWLKGGGGHSGTKWLPTAKRPHGAELVNAKI